MKSEDSKGEYPSPLDFWFCRCPRIPDPTLEKSRERLYLQIKCISKEVVLLCGTVTCRYLFVYSFKIRTMRNYYTDSWETRRFFFRDREFCNDLYFDRRLLVFPRKREKERGVNDLADGNEERLITLHFTKKREKKNEKREQTCVKF